MESECFTCDTIDEEILQKRATESCSEVRVGSLAKLRDDVFQWVAVTICVTAILSQKVYHVRCS